MSSRPELAVLALAVNALVWGLSWWPLRQLELNGLHPLWATAFIFTLATVMLTLITPSGWRGLKHRPQLWWLMVASGLTNVGFNWAVTTGDVVRVVLLFYLMPAWSLLLAWWLLREQPNRSAISRLLLALLGVALVLKTPESNWPLPQDLSDVLALAAGFCFALTNILLLRLQDTSESSRMITMFSGGAVMAVACALLASYLGIIPAEQLLVFDTHVLDAISLKFWSCSPWVLGLSVAFLISNFTLQYGAARLSAHTTSMVMMSEVVVASLSSVGLRASELTWRVSLGGAMIVLAAVLASQFNAKRNSV